MNPPAPKISQQPHSNTVQGSRLKAAIAVPLSFLAFILLLVGVFTFHLHRHRLADEPAISAAEKIDESRQWSLDSSDSVKTIDDMEKALDIVPGPLPSSASATGFPQQALGEDKRCDEGTSPHQVFQSLRQNPISSVHVVPTTVPASVFRTMTHARAVETSGTVTSPMVPVHIPVLPLKPSPLRKSFVEDEDDVL